MFNREQYAAAINRAGEGEGLAYTSGPVSGLYYVVTEREAEFANQLDVREAMGNSVLASATYTIADMAGARSDIKEGLTLSASAISDMAFAAAQTKAHRDVNMSWGNYQFGPQPESMRGAPLEQD